MLDYEMTKHARKALEEREILIETKRSPQFRLHPGSQVLFGRLSSHRERLRLVHLHHRLAVYLLKGGPQHVMTANNLAECLFQRLDIQGPMQGQSDGVHVSHGSGIEAIDKPHPPLAETEAVRLIERAPRNVRILIANPGLRERMRATPEFCFAEFFNAAAQIRDAVELKQPAERDMNPELIQDTGRYSGHLQRIDTKLAE